MEINEEAVRQMRKENDLIPVYKMVDTCAAEFESKHLIFIVPMNMKMKVHDQKSPQF